MLTPLTSAGLTDTLKVAVWAFDKVGNRASDKRRTSFMSLECIGISLMVVSEGWSVNPPYLLAGKQNKSNKCVAERRRR
jgi:hypothetical protein